MTGLHIHGGLLSFHEYYVRVGYEEIWQKKASKVNIAKGLRGKQLVSGTAKTGKLSLLCHVLGNLNIWKHAGMRIKILVVGEGKLCNVLWRRLGSFGWA